MDTMEMEESSIKAKWPAPHTRIYAELLSDFQARLKEKGAAKTMAPHIGKGMTFGLPFLRHPINIEQIESIVNQ